MFQLCFNYFSGILSGIIITFTFTLKFNYTFNFYNAFNFPQGILKASLKHESTWWAQHVPFSPSTQHVSPLLSSLQNAAASTEWLKRVVSTEKGTCCVDGEKETCFVDVGKETCCVVGEKETCCADQKKEACYVDQKKDVWSPLKHLEISSEYIANT